MRNSCFLDYLNETLDDQTASRLTEAIFVAGGIDYVIELLENTK
jgi:hypothetical protein